MTPEIVLGPPGTGKTTELLRLVEEELGRGVAPDRIGYVTFTRRGAEEAMTRARGKFNLTSKELPYFSTLHSLCFRQLGLRRGDVLEGARLRDFANHVGVEINGKWSDDGTLTGYGLGDRILFMENLARVRGTPLRAAYDSFDDQLPWREVDRVSRALAQYKETTGLMDFTDMLSEFVRSGMELPLEVLFVDEAQDLSYLQWMVVLRLAAGVRRLVIAGDDDQAIYRWAGADAGHLIEMEGITRVLGQSWRVPRVIAKLANEVISGVKHRRDKEWRAREGVEGSIGRTTRFDEVDVGAGEVLILTRNAYLIREQVTPELRRQGIVYELHGHSSIKASYLEAIRDWEALRRGEGVPVAQVRKIYEQMSSRRGYKHGFKTLPNLADEQPVTATFLREQGGLLTDAIWHQALDRLPEDEVAYITAALARGEKITKKPRVTVSTIHGSKGGEADQVVLFKEMARRTYVEMIEGGEEDEMRVWYVAATRAKHHLTIIESGTKQECPWL